MTEADEALLWARENTASTQSSPYTYALARAYRAGVAASAERIKALEAALRDALPHLETCFRHHVWRNEPMPEPGYLKNIRALLKDPDQ